MTTGVDVTGIALVLGHAYDIAITFVLLWIAYGMGRAFIARCLPSVFALLDRPTERLVFSTVCGVGFLGTWILIGCAVLGVHPWSLGFLLLLALGSGVPHALDLPRLLIDTWSEFAGGVGVSGQIVFILAIGVVLILAMAPPTDWDALSYHLDIPWNFLAEGRIHVPDDNLHVAYVGLLHMLYLPLIAFGSGSGPAILNGFFAAILALTVFAFGSRFFPGPAARLSPSLLWGTTFLFLVAATARLDTTLAVFLFLGQYTLFIVYFVRWSGTALLLSALLFGFAGGMKYQALAFLVAMSPMIVWTIHRRTADWLAALKTGLLYAAVVVLCLSPWLIKNAILLDGPLYPFFTDRKAPGWVAEISGSEQIPPSIDKRAFGAYRQARDPFNLTDFVLAPGRLTVEPEGPLYATNMLLVFVLLAPLFARDGRLMWLVLPPAAFIAIVVLPFSTTNVRYLIPAIPALTIASAEIARRVMSAVLPTVFTKALLGVATGLVLVPAIVAVAVLFSRFRAPQHAMGLVSASEYLSGYILTNVDEHWEMARLVNERADGRRVLMLFDGRGFYFTAPVIQDTAMSAWPLLVGTGATADCLSGDDIGYVLVNRGVVEYFRGRGVDFGPLRWDAFEDFTRRCLSPVTRDAGSGVVRGGSKVTAALSGPVRSSESVIIQPLT